MKDRTITIRIPLLVGSNGKWAAQGSYSTENDPDWDFMSEIADYEKPIPNETRCWVTVEVTLPEDLEFKGTAAREE